MAQLSDFLEIGSRVFNHGDQIRFAEYSGDFNPIHVDQMQIPTSMFDGCIVHGVHSMLWQLECLQNYCDRTPSSFHVSWNKPVKLEQHVKCVWDASDQLMLLLSDNGEVLSTLKVNGFLEGKIQDYSLTKDIQKPSLRPLLNDFSSLSLNDNPRLIFSGDLIAGKQMFPKLCNALSTSSVFEMAQISNIVGMQTPGLNSIFISGKFSFRKHVVIKDAELKIVGLDERWKKIDMHYDGQSLDCKFSALERPYYRPKSCAELVHKLNTHSNLTGKRVLILGGSRGIGAMVAKICGLLGAEVSISYNFSSTKADLVCKDILDATGVEPTKIKFDAFDRNASDEIVKYYDTLFYFCSPQITENKNGFDLELFDRFLEVYCKAFEKIALNFLKFNNGDIFWPSSIYVEDKPENHLEYTRAKTIGEMICAKLSEEYCANITTLRLPKTKTDQTIGIMSHNLENADDVALAIVSRMFNSNVKI